MPRASPLILPIAFSGSAEGKAPDDSEPRRLVVNFPSALQQEVKSVSVDEDLVSYTVAIAGRTRESEYLSLGVSPRGSMALYQAAQALAYLRGRRFTTPDDFKSLAIPVFAHRVVLNSRYTSTLKKSDQAAEALREIVDSVPVPM